MKRITFLFFAYLCTISSFAQTQQGIVKTRGRMVNGQIVSGKRLTGATITLNFGNPLVSGQNGAFIFNVPSGKNYSLVSAKKQGYTLADPEYTRRSFAYSAKNPFYVVLEDEAQRQADINAATKKVRRTLTAQLQAREDEIETLKEQNKLTEAEYQQRLQQLYVNQSKSEQLIKEMAERYTWIDYDQLDEFNRKVQMFIEEGELIKADSLLNTQGSIEEMGAELDRMDIAIETDRRDIARRQQSHEQAVALKKQKLEEFANNCYNRHLICKLKHENDSAAYWLEIRANKDTTNIDWLIEAGEFIWEYIVDIDKAETYFQKALSVTIEQYGKEHALVARCYNNLGRCYRRKGLNAEAIDAFLKAIDIGTKVYGENDENVAFYISGLSTVYHDLGINCDEEEEEQKKDYLDKGMQYAKKALRIRQNLFGENHPDVATSYNNIGCLYGDLLSLSDPGEATGSLYFHYLEKALNIRLAVYGETHPDVANSYSNVGSCYFDQEEDSLALVYANKSIEIYKAYYGESHILTINAYKDLGDLLYRHKKYSEALKYFHLVELARTKKYGKYSVYLYDIYEAIASCLYNLGFFRTSLEYELLLRDMVKTQIEETKCSECDSELAYRYCSIADCYLMLNDYEQANEFINKAFVFDPESQKVVGTKGVLLLMQNKYDEALELWNKTHIPEDAFCVFSDGRFVNCLLEVGLIDRHTKPIVLHNIKIPISTTNQKISIAIDDRVPITNSEVCSITSGLHSIMFSVDNHSTRTICVRADQQIDRPLDPSLNMQAHTDIRALKEQVFTIAGVSFKMKPVEGGTFTMGATEEQADLSLMSRPIHEVTLDDYLIGETEVTQSLWLAVMGDNPSIHQGKNHPVENVSWNDCLQFISKLNSLTGLNFRLPTEAEWEYAARGGNKSNSTRYSGSKDFEEVGWEFSDEKSTHDVALLKPNELGLYDMSGNVGEWCQDVYCRYMQYEQINPIGLYPSPDTDNHVFRDGESSISNRCYSSQEDAEVYIGLRLVLDVSTTKP